MKTEEVRVMLRKRYAPPEWSLLEEVRNTTGFSGVERFADAIAMNLWPSRGMGVLGFEIKVSRSDWKAELADPSKSDAIQRYCDHWWVVAGAKSIVQESELPPTWGLMLAGTDRLVILKDAPKLQPIALDRGFIGSILRRAHHTMDAARRNGEDYQRGLADGEARGKLTIDYKFSSLERELSNLKSSIASFEEAAGLRIDEYNGYSLGAAVKVVQTLRGQHLDSRAALKAAKQPLEAALRLIEALESVGRLTGAVVASPAP